MTDIADEIDIDVVPVAFDDGAILTALGRSPEIIKRTLRAYKQAGLHEPSDMAIYQWVSRDHISDRWRPRLLYAALKSGKLSMAGALRFEQLA